jgi:hypothetical protein
VGSTLLSIAPWSAGADVHEPMPRRKPYTKVVKHNQRRAAHVEGESDRLYRLISCLNLECKNNFVVSDEEASSDAVLVCAVCGYEHQRGRTTKFYDYELVLVESGEALGDGAFEIAHDAHLDTAPVCKYCIVCSTLQPAANFDRHGSRRSGLQGECRVCKQVYNDLKNGSRLPEQHREAADYRRMMVEFASEAGHLEISSLYERFEGKCFKCDRALVESTSTADGYRLDHTLPAKFLWPLTNGPTLLCHTCNSAKAEKWPSEFYEPTELRRLAVLTDIDYGLLAGEACYNPAAIEYLQENSDKVIEAWIAYAPRLRQLRQRIFDATGVDVFATAAHSPSAITLSVEASR